MALTVCLAIHPLKDSWIYLHFLVNLNKAPVAVHIQVFVSEYKFSFLWGLYLEVGLLSFYITVSLCVTF